MTWFEQLTGLKESSATEVRSGLKLEGTRLTSLANGCSWDCGEFEVVSLENLRERIKTIPPTGRLRLREEVADVQQLHANSKNAGAFFQVASQFNLLEMTDPSRTPDDGIGCYQFDRTQGPACAMAAGAGTIFRNYLVPLGDGVGQSAQNQLDCLESLGRPRRIQRRSLFIWSPIAAAALSAASILTGPAIFPQRKTGRPTECSSACC